MEDYGEAMQPLFNQIIEDNNDFVPNFELQYDDELSVLQSSQEKIDKLIQEQRSGKTEPYNKIVIYLACSVCTGKFQTSVFYVRTERSEVRTVKTSVWYFPVQTSRSLNNLLVLHQWIGLYIWFVNS